MNPKDWPNHNPLDWMDDGEIRERVVAQTCREILKRQLVECRVAEQKSQEALVKAMAIVREARTRHAKTLDLVEHALRRWEAIRVL